MGEVDDPHHPEDDGEAQGQERVEAPVHQAVEELDREVFHRSGRRAPRVGRATSSSYYLGILQPVSASGRETLSAGSVLMIFE